MSDEVSTRQYRSELRAEQARRTRAGILTACADLFSAQGYQATTIAAIARRARVSAETVKAAGSKAELLIASFEVLFALEEGQKSLAASEAGRGVLALSDEALLPAVTAAITEANARARRLWTQLLAAAQSDELVADALARMLDNRHADFRGLVDELVRRGLTRPDLDAGAAAAELSFLFSPEGYQQLVDQSGWSEQRYREWLLGAAARTVGR